MVSDVLVEVALPEYKIGNLVIVKVPRLTTPLAVDSRPSEGCPLHWRMTPALISKVAPSETYTPPAPSLEFVDVQL